MEVLVSLYTKHKFVNRGFFIGPYCPIYGCGCLLITFLLKQYMDDIIVLFTMAIVICSILEYGTSYVMEKLFHARWWDYSDSKFNLNGRICLETMVPFGVLGCVVMYLINPLLNMLIDLMPYTVLEIVSISLFIVFLIDNIISFEVISNFKRVSFAIKKDSTEEITKKVRETLSRMNFLDKRLVDAFPDLEVFKRHTKEKIEQTKREIKAKQKEMTKISKDIKKKEKTLKRMKR